MTEVKIDKYNSSTELYEIKIVLTDQLLFDFIETSDAAKSKEIIMKLVSMKIDEFFFNNCPSHLVPNDVLMNARKCKVIIDD